MSEPLPLRFFGANGHIVTLGENRCGEFCQ